MFDPFRVGPTKLIRLAINVRPHRGHHQICINCWKYMSKITAEHNIHHQLNILQLKHH